MTSLLYIGIVAEMLIVNLSTVDLCSKRKYSISKTIGALLLYSAVIIGVFMTLISKSSAYGNGNGAFVLLGFLYLPVLCFLYADSFVRILELLCSSWIYTMLAFIISVHTAKLLNPDLFAYMVFFVQTLLYLSTLAFFRRFIRVKIVYILQNISPKIHYFLLKASVLWFLTLLGINLSFIYPQAWLFKFCAFAFIATIAYASYSLIYELTISNANSKKMEKIANTDYLTSLPNRLNLSTNITNMIQKGEPFSIFYIDLNNFKSINDRFGHSVGDQYIVEFVKQMNSVCSDMGTLYRISGDEFLFVTWNSLYDNLEARIRGIAFKHDKPAPFLGVCMGIACYPQDGNTFDALLAIADGRMYDEKRSCGK